jgi:glutathione synthase/RimK-type ligase-like ATP-grasp enzyme
MFYVYTPRPSRSARALARALGGRRIKSFQNLDPAFLTQTGHTIINWGDSQCSFHPIMNNADAIRVIANKLKAFHVFQTANVPIPRFAETREDVSWEGLSVVRHKLTGHSGEGIELIPPGQELPDAPLYVEYIKKQDEYRIHVGRIGDEKSIISVQQKRRRTSVPDSDVNWQVRNHANGFIFARQDTNPPASVTKAAVDALGASGLDFGAVDVIYNQSQEKAYVLEINTAPGLEGQTITDYRDFFKTLAGPA